jgi:hypothetical protein
MDDGAWPERVRDAVDDERNLAAEPAVRLLEPVVAVLAITAVGELGAHPR